MTSPDANSEPAAVNPETSRARYIMIGGFLGAGKTTAVARLARHLTDQGLRVGLITNDQGTELVDTAMLAARGFPVEEIAGGCFCCRFNSLLEAARKLSTETRPDVFIAEPVGSCTDLVATVSYPLRRIYGHAFALAPLSVLVDPVRAARVLGLTDGSNFSDKVRYIYRKQLEEADLIVINKTDLLNTSEREGLRSALSGQFPHAELHEISARQGAGLDEWFARLTTAGPMMHAAMEVDYDVYAEGEALLGWLNATVDLSAATPFDGNQILTEVAQDIQEHLSTQSGEIAHLKMTLDPTDGLGELAVINLVRNDYVPELSQRLEDPLSRGQLIINVRAETSPEVLRQGIETALGRLSLRGPGLSARIEHLEFFRPGRPEPTHRMATPDN